MNTGNPDMLYESYFNVENVHFPYSDSAEQMKELLCMLDVSLHLYAKMRQEQGDNASRLRMRGLVITDADFYEAVMGYGSHDERLMFSEASEELKKCRLHIDTRCKLTQKTSIILGFNQLCEMMSLTPFEAFCLILSAACDLDRKYERIFGYLQDDVNEKLPTLGLAFCLYQFIHPIEDQEVFRVLDERRPFRFLLLEPLQANEKASRLSLPLHVRQRVLGYITGSNREDPVLETLLTYKQFNTPCDPMLLRQEWIPRLQNMVAAISAADHKDFHPALHLYGMKGIGKRTLIMNLGAAMEVNLCFIDMNRLFSLGQEQAKVVQKAILLELYLKNSIACFCICTPQETAENIALWESFLKDFFTEFKRYLGFYILLSEEKNIFQNKTVLSLASIELPPLTVQENLLLWQYYGKQISMSEDTNLAFYANKYSFSIARIKEVLKTSALYAAYENRELVDAKDIDRAVKQLSAGSLSMFASYIKPAFTWDDLVVGDSQRQMLQYICDCVRYKSVVEDDWGFRKKLPYGRGISAVFYGSPGTGKTMAVQVLANELNLDFYRVDLSQMVSKYIGETEKNITNLFREAKSINAALFFDEADAFFSKRTEINSSNDKNANNESAHLLQQMEDFDGVVILATNYIANIDEAFKRRLRVSVNFSLPNLQQRIRIWKNLLPAEMEIDDDYIRDLAVDFELSGSNIKEIVVNAAYAAAGSHLNTIDMGSIVKALKIHCMKHNKNMDSAIFGKYEVFLS